MTLKDVEDVLGENKLSYAKLTMSDIASIMEYVEATLLIDKECLDYYYEIDVNDLISSSMPAYLLDDLKRLGWSFNSDKSKLLIYLKND